MRAFIALGALLVALPTFACENAMGVEDWTESPEKAVRAAATMLGKHRYSDAIRIASGVLGGGKEYVAPLAVQHEARRILGFAQLALGQFEQAQHTFEAALRENADDPIVTCRLAQALEALGAHAQARELFEPLRVNDLLPDPEAHLVYAQALNALNDVDGALAEVEAALRQSPRHAAALELRAKLKQAKKAPRPRT